jgi:palmitoyltransferase ZDHHC1/11
MISVSQLAIEIGVGIGVLVICFANKNSERIIQDRLGNGLPRPAFATIVVSCGRNRHYFIAQF